MPWVVLLSWLSIGYADETSPAEVNATRVARTAPTRGSYISGSRRNVELEMPAPRELSVPAVPEVVESTRRFSREYVLAPLDSVEVVVLKHPEVGRTVAIRPDGYLTLPVVDDVKAAGMTPSELDQKITELLAPRLVNPEVSIIVTSLRPPAVYVVGDVAQPTIVPLRDATTVFQAVARAGGFTTKSAKRSVILIRLQDDNRLTATRLDLEQRGKGAAYLALNNVPLEAEDIVFVPKTLIARLNVFINENINTVLTGVNSVLSTYNQIRFTEIIDRQLRDLDRTGNQ
ncbi:MAG: polysaccharide biosynthesis/export family protein [Candidatus Hydrogenedentes bacterium]|nr:polysaccharide biosynthesis/export family protein [Candidatus Hydrogenedentota bacterium]